MKAAQSRLRSSQKIVWSEADDADIFSDGNSCSHSQKERLTDSNGSPNSISADSLFLPVLSRRPSIASIRSDPSTPQRRRSLTIDNEDLETVKDEPLTPEVEVMTNVLRFFQLLCENHNRDMQVGT